jgi:hypothetical protein
MGSSVSVLRDTIHAGLGAPNALARKAGVPTIVRHVLRVPASSVMRGASCVLLDISGRKVMDLHPGANDVRALAPGVYLVRETQAQAQARAVRKVILTR